MKLPTAKPNTFLPPYQPAKSAAPYRGAPHSYVTAEEVRGHVKRQSEATAREQLRRFEHEFADPMHVTQSHRWGK